MLAHTSCCANKQQCSCCLQFRSPMCFYTGACLLSRTKVFNILRQHKMLGQARARHTTCNTTWQPQLQAQGTAQHQLILGICAHTLASRVRNSSSLMGNSRWAVTSEGVLRLSLLLITPPCHDTTQHNTCAAAPLHAPQRPALLTL